MVKWLVTIVMLLGLSSYFLPDHSLRVIPVAGATTQDWNAKSFWYYPWGRSGIHKGIDIFAQPGTPVLSSSRGLVWSYGYDSMGGNYVLIVGAQWRFHYYAHLASINTQRFAWVAAGEQIGTVGDTGNAKGKPAHLHYQINNTIPTAQPEDTSTGYLKSMYTNPQEFLKQAKTIAIAPH